MVDPLLIHHCIKKVQWWLKAIHMKYSQVLLMAVSLVVKQF